MVSCFRIPTHYVLVMDSGDAFKDFVTSEQTYGFINLASKTSADLPRTGSAFLQQTSVAQGNGLPIETPVNKVSFCIYFLYDLFI